MTNYLEKFNKLRPLIGVFSFVILSTIIVSTFLEASLMVAGQLFMAFFFLTFGGFKTYNLKGFREAFKMYDPLAKKSDLYADFYPFIELALGAFYLLIAFSSISFELFVYLATVLVVGINAAGVFEALRNEREIQCACLGDVFNVPMTRVTLIEDLLMLLMALSMLIL